MNCHACGTQLAPTARFCHKCGAASGGAQATGWRAGLPWALAGVAVGALITVVGLQLGGIIAFAIITETVFQWPGMGLLFIQAVQFADIPVMAAYLCLIGLIFVAINLIVDILAAVIDPRIRLTR